jgi:dolichyl-phosphate-mannose-protein mannosyltransferase
MWATNAGLTDRHTYDSRPDSWPHLRRGIVGGLQLGFCRD